MKYNPDIPHRRSIRLRDYDYAPAGAYFMTVCAQGRETLFGEVGEGEMFLNDGERMVQAAWQTLPDHYPGLEIDCHVVMPNHFHGIIRIVGAGPRACPGVEVRANKGIAIITP